MGKDKKESMTVTEKLDLINQEIRTLHQFCINKGYNPFEVEKTAQPLLSYVRKERRKKWCWRLGQVALLVALVVMLAYYDPVYRFMLAYGRYAAIQILPYWNWAKLYTEDCLIDNPYYQFRELLEEDCEMCENLETVQRRSNMSQMVMAEDFLKRDIPVIVTDGTEDWLAMKSFSIAFLDKLYNEEETLKEVLPCMFVSNVRIKYGNGRVLLRKGAQGDISNWYGHWENCDKKAAKTLRQFYRRPYFMPAMVEMSESNWIFIASQYHGKKYKPADIGMPMMMFTQVTGQSKIQLAPRHPCNETCPKLYATLHEKETLVVTDLMWLLDYTPVGEKESIAIGAGGFFD